MALTIALADEHPIFRRGLQALLQGEADFKVVGEAADGLEAVRLSEQLQPDILLVDLMMPGLNGVEAVRQVTKRSPQTRVVILSMHTNEANVLEALRAGATAYVVKEAPGEEVIHAIRLAAAGKRYLSAAVSERAIEVYIRNAEMVDGDPYETLTEREREVFQQVAEGYSNSEIATRLFISQRTVEHHRANLMRKLNLRNQTELIRCALRRGILPMESLTPPNPPNSSPTSPGNASAPE